MYKDISTNIYYSPNMASLSRDTLVPWSSSGRDRPVYPGVGEKVQGHVVEDVPRVGVRRSRRWPAPRPCLFTSWVYLYMEYMAECPFEESD